MGYSTAVEREQGSEGWTVSLRVNLSRAETNELFLSGDSILSWPVDGVLSSEGDDPKPERSGMFVSEVAAQPLGLTIRYVERAQAERSAALLRAQLAQIGISEEG
ncbi:MAG: hypothetical protein A2W26_09415 [Acidobacteria bacterium RBG_16_64_8]|nr:MAG: hypothetical protein A2W26_09415 [Acidobacteria bacterium RBG_16_64_8]